MATASTMVAEVVAAAMAMAAAAVTAALVLLPLAAAPPENLSLLSSRRSALARISSGDSLRKLHKPSRSMLKPWHSFTAKQVSMQFVAQPSRASYTSMTKSF